MKTDIIIVNSQGDQMELALSQAEKVSAYKELSDHNALHLRLLSEEMMNLMRAITGESQGLFWIEDHDDIYELHLQVESPISSTKRMKLLSTSSSGKNEAAKGFMGSLRTFFFGPIDEQIASASNSTILMGGVAASKRPVLNWQWTMNNYENTLREHMQEQEEGAIQAWDELEKSIVKKIADDVKVSIKGWEVELIIYKKITDNKD